MDQYLTVLQAVATTSAIVTVVVFYWRRTLYSPSIFRSNIPPEFVDFIDQESLEVAAAICDTLLPSHDDSVVDQHRIQLFVYKDHTCDTKWEKDLYSLLLRFAGIENTTFTSSTIASTTHAFQLTQLLQQESRNYLYRGAFAHGRQGTTPSSSKIHIEVCNAMNKVLLPEDKQQISVFLKVMSTSVGSLLLVGYPVPFPCLTLSCRITALKRLQTSYLWQMRGAFLAFKRAAGFLFLSSTLRGTTNPNWLAIRYDPEQIVSKSRPEGNDTEKEDQKDGNVQKLSTLALSVLNGGNNEDGGQGGSPTKRLSAVALRSLSLQSAHAFVLPSSSNPSPGSRAIDQHSPIPGPASPPTPVPSQTSSPTGNHRFDVIVVGSGSGGGVIATELVNAGLDVLLLEKGEHWAADDFKMWRETEACAKTLERGGLCTTEDGAIVVLAGSCVGGGSTVNWSASLRTPRHVLRGWSCDLHMRQFDPDDIGPDSFNASLDAVHGLLSVNSNMSHQQHPPTTTTTQLPAQPSSSSPSFVVNENNRLLWSSAEDLGLLPELIPRNVVGCVDCGHCSHGCPYDAKQSTATALIEPILRQQQQTHPQATSPSSDNDKGRLTLIANCRVLRVLTQPISSSFSSSDGYSTIACGVEALWNEYPATDPLHHPLGPDRAPPPTTKRLVFHASIVISSSGALHTPALLLRSGLKHPKIGRHLCLHPVVAVAGLMSDDVDTGLSKGVGMGVIVRSTTNKASGADATIGCSTDAAVADVDPSSSSTSKTMCRGIKGVTPRCQDVLSREWGVIIETPPVHPGLAGTVLPWINGLLYKLAALNYSHMSAFIAIARDHSSAENRIVLSSSGEPIIRYHLTKEDKNTLQAGFELLVRMMKASNAAIIIAGTEDPKVPWFINNGGNSSSNGSSSSIGDDDDTSEFESFLSTLDAVGIVPNTTGLYSAHQMGSCRMAANRKDGPLQPSGETYECKGLYVADASTFPTSLGVNPMITVTAMAHFVSRNVLRQHFPKLFEKVKSVQLKNSGCHVSKNNNNDW